MLKQKFCKRKVFCSVWNTFDFHITHRAFLPRFVCSPHKVLLQSFQVSYQLCFVFLPRPMNEFLLIPYNDILTSSLTGIWHESIISWTSLTQDVKVWGMRTMITADLVSDYCNPMRIARNQHPPIFGNLIERNSYFRLYLVNFFQASDRGRNNLHIHHLEPRKTIQSKSGELWFSGENIDSNIGKILKGINLTAFELPKYCYTMSVLLILQHENNNRCLNCWIPPLNRQNLDKYFQVSQKLQDIVTFAY